MRGKGKLIKEIPFNQSLIAARNNYTISYSKERINWLSYLIPYQHIVTDWPEWKLEFHVTYSAPLPYNSRFITKIYSGPNVDHIHCKTQR